MKTTNMLITLSAAVLFSGSAMAGSFADRQKEDILHGQGVTTSSQAQPHVAGVERPDGLSRYMKYNAQNIEPSSPHMPYERGENDRDNSGDLLDSV